MSSILGKKLDKTKTKMKSKAITKNHETPYWASEAIPLTPTFNELIGEACEFEDDFIPGEYSFYIGILAELQPIMTDFGDVYIKAKVIDIERAPEESKRPFTDEELRRFNNLYLVDLTFPDFFDKNKLL